MNKQISAKKAESFIDEIKSGLLKIYNTGYPNEFDLMSDIEKVIKKINSCRDTGKEEECEH